MNTATKTKKTGPRTSPASQLLDGNKRLLLLQGIRGMWKNRRPTPIQELKKIRREWERDIA